MFIYFRYFFSNGDDYRNEDSLGYFFFFQIFSSFFFQMDLSD